MKKLWDAPTSCIFTSTPGNADARPNLRTFVWTANIPEARSWNLGESLRSAEPVWLLWNHSSHFLAQPGGKTRPFQHPCCAAWKWQLEEQQFLAHMQMGRAVCPVQVSPTISWAWPHIMNTQDQLTQRKDDILVLLFEWSKQIVHSSVLSMKPVSPPQCHPPCVSTWLTKSVIVQNAASGPALRL